MKNETAVIGDEIYYDERSAGGLVYKIENNKVFWLVIKTVSKFNREKTSQRDWGKSDKSE